MLLHRFFTPGLAISSYIVADEISKKAAVIDPTRDVGSYIHYATKEKLVITDILETHVHADFVSGAPELKRKLGDVPTIHCSAMGGQEWIPTYADNFIKDKDEVSLGSLRLQAWHTPGHTPEHVMWVLLDTAHSNPQVPLLVFTGDLIFVGGVGRPDLLGEKWQTQLVGDLYQTLFERIPMLPDDVELFPAHGAGSLCGKEIGKQPSSKLGYERQHNPGLQKEDFQQWSNSLLKDMPVAPKYFSRMKQVNVSGLKNTLPNSYVIIDANLASTLIPECTLIDIRNSDAFAQKHIKGSINIPPSPNFAFWAANALSGEEEILFVASSIGEVPSAIEAFKLVGIDAIKGIILSSAWDESAQKDLWKNLLESTPTMDVETLVARKNELYILDVRTLAEWNAGHIPEAHLIELNALNDSLALIPKDKPIAVICHSGNRSSLAASILLKAGFPSVASVKGGMQAWLKYM